MVSAGVGRRRTASLLAAATVVAALLPPAHIHLAARDDHHHEHGRAAAIEHAHWSAHGSSRTAFDDEDGQTIYVDRPAVTSAADTAVARPPAAVIGLLTLPARATFTVAERPTSGNSPRDGPPRRLSALRAPPLVL